MSDNKENYDVFDTSQPPSGYSSNGIPEYAIHHPTNALANPANPANHYGLASELQPGQFVQIRSKNHQIVIVCDNIGNMHVWTVNDKLI